MSHQDLKTLLECDSYQYPADVKDNKRPKVIVGDRVHFDSLSHGPTSGVVTAIHVCERSHVQTVFTLTDVTWHRSGISSRKGDFRYFSNDLSRITIINRQPLPTPIPQPIITVKQLDKIMNISANSQFINKINSRYYEAILDLKSKSQIGIFGEAVFKLGKLELIGMSTESKAFIFDIGTIGMIPESLKLILENPKCQKVVFNTNVLIPQLQFYNIIPKALCDLVLMNAKIEWNLESILCPFIQLLVIKYLKFDDSMLCSLDCTDVDRPYSTHLLEYIASYLSLMLPLKDEMMNSIHRFAKTGFNWRLNSIREEFCDYEAMILKSEETEVDRNLRRAFTRCLENQKF